MFWEAIFFIVFFKISLFYGSLYLALGVGAAFSGLAVINSRLRRAVFFGLGHLFYALLWLLLIQSVWWDTLTLESVHEFDVSFVVRTLSLIGMSVIPGVTIGVLYVQNSTERLRKIVLDAFVVQFLFWAVTFLWPEDVKVFLYHLMGQSSVNLRPYNLEVRGFGLSNGVNYMSPVMMVIVSVMVLGYRGVTVMTMVTQLVNSNLVAVGIFLSVFFRRINPGRVVFAIFGVSAVVLLFGQMVFRRFFAELQSGGLRTVTALVNRHIFFNNDGVLQHIFGSGEIVYGGAAERMSDIGWVIMYNYGGALFVLLFFLLIGWLCIRAFGFNRVALMWLVLGVVLNTKGMAYGPNIYFFMSSLLAGCRWSGFDVLRMTGLGDAGTRPRGFGRSGTLRKRSRERINEVFAGGSSEAG
ncbi:hypothetical protein [Arhodomonas sp. KWT2]|uniref:hypothetical protein n=1 Tax=Arhodomonas sp. KWT2 TaxID=3344194 RepID=UPI0035C2249A